MGTITEDHASRSIQLDEDSASSEFAYTLTGYASEGDALGALIQNSPLYVVVNGGLVDQRSISLEPEFFDSNGGSVYRGTVSYTSREKENPDDPEKPEDPTSFSFSFGSMQDVKTHSGDQDSYKLGKPVANGIESGINRKHKDLEPEGMSINKPIVTISAKTVVSQAMGTNLWFKERLDQVWTLNAYTWRSLPPRSVAFTGLDGSRRSDGHWDVTYNFEYRPDNPGRSFKASTDPNAGTINVPATGGWDYLWAAWDKFETAEEGSPDRSVNRVINAIHVTKDVYPTSDFSLLGMVGV